jgi:hypothetical protein
MHVMTLAISDDNACTQETDSGHDTLDNTARVGAVDRVDRQNGERRSEGNEGKCAHTRCLAVKIAIEAQHGANHSRSAEPKGDVKGVHSGRI